MEVREPLLFIQSPPFYYVEVKETEVEADTLLDESTSVYEISRTEKIQNEVIVRQLSYFSQPNHRHRNLVFHLDDGDKITGRLEEVDGISVKIKTTTNNLILINGNEIKAITI
ncbi:hypothetical protein [Ureibacillus massiliensis]|uniref:hypothetical protein n=1 Tax=Ureibacillus massiliensis TaxID=292806 RepID=UPI0006901503|nr:hypothetical protein [Ureibacillus massiliensis]